MSAIDSLDFEDTQKLPPLWGKSYWWSRTGALLGLTSLILGALMVYLLSLHVGSCGLARQLTTPTVAIEVAGSWQDVLAIVGTCEISDCRQSTNANACDTKGRCQTICPDKVQALATEQYIDFVFIVIYWLFFVYLGVMNWKVAYWSRYPIFTQVIGKLCGAATIIAGSRGAWADWRENNHILQALYELHLMSGPAPLMRDFAYAKWRLLFLAIGTASPLFIFWSGKSNNGGIRASAFSHLAAWVTAILRHEHRLDRGRRLYVRRRPPSRGSHQTS